MGFSSSSALCLANALPAVVVSSHRPTILLNFLSWSWPGNPLFADYRAKLGSLAGLLDAPDIDDVRDITLFYLLRVLLPEWYGLSFTSSRKLCILLWALSIISTVWDAILSRSLFSRGSVLLRSPRPRSGDRAISLFLILSGLIGYNFFLGSGFYSM
jgi:hypothetical protein